MTKSLSEALARLLPEPAGRQLLVLGQVGCAPCKMLLRALTELLDPEHLSQIKVSVYSPPDVAIRSAHRRLGGLSYPHCLMLQDGCIVGAVSGFEEVSGAPVVETQIRFLRDGDVAPHAQNEAERLAA